MKTEGDLLKLFESTADILKMVNDLHGQMGCQIFKNRSHLWNVWETSNIDVTSMDKH